MHSGTSEAARCEEIGDGLSISHCTMASAIACGIDRDLVGVRFLG